MNNVVPVKSIRNLEFELWICTYIKYSKKRVMFFYKKTNSIFIKYLI